ncbi:hypothetical protein ABW19_dt0200295 [Dactylella cylindrospora]|nr:hypothetical protein ABW19_dt0200295 [Dactylella cylindrospora]
MNLLAPILIGDSNRELEPVFVPLNITCAVWENNREALVELLFDGGSLTEAVEALRSIRNADEEYDGWASKYRRHTRELTQILQELANHGWDLSSPGSDGLTPLSSQTRLQYERRIIFSDWESNVTHHLRWLLERGADPTVDNLPDENDDGFIDYSPVDYAGKYILPSAAELLLLNGATSWNSDFAFKLVYGDIKDTENSRRLFDIYLDHCYPPNYGARRRILHEYCPFSRTGSSSYLYFAIVRGPLFAVKAILGHGVGTMVLPEENISALDVARKFKKEEMIEYLETFQSAVEDQEIVEAHEAARKGMISFEISSSGQRR